MVLQEAAEMSLCINTGAGFCVRKGAVSLTRIGKHGRVKPSRDITFFIILLLTF